MPTDLETQLALSVELARSSPELRRYVQGLVAELRNARIALALQAERHAERVESLAFFKPQIGPTS